MLDICEETFRLIDQLLTEVWEGLDGRRDWPPKQEQECIAVSCLNLLKLQLHAMLIHRYCSILNTAKNNKNFHCNIFFQAKEHVNVIFGLVYICLLICFQDKKPFPRIWNVLVDLSETEGCGISQQFWRSGNYSEICPDLSASWMEYLTAHSRREGKSSFYPNR